MNSQQLTRQQAETIFRALQPKLGYLSKLRRRMEQTGFPPDDKLFRLTVAAQDALQSLYIETHYLSCHGGVGRPPR